MQENSFEYRPFWLGRVSISFFICIKVMEIIMLVLAGMMLEQKDYSVFMVCFSLALVCVGLNYRIVIYPSHIRVYGRQDGIHVIDQHPGERFVPWEKLSCGYYAHDLKNFQFIVLAETPLAKKQRRKLASASSRWAKIICGTSVVLPMSMGRADGVEECLKQYVQFQNRPDWKF